MYTHITIENTNTSGFSISKASHFDSWDTHDFGQSRRGLWLVKIFPTRTLKPNLFSSCFIYRPSVPETWQRLMTEASVPFPAAWVGSHPSFLAVPGPQRVTSSLFQERRSVAHSGFSGSGDLSQVPSHNSKALGHTGPDLCDNLFSCWPQVCSRENMYKTGKFWAAFSSHLKMIQGLEQAKGVCLDF